MNKAELAHKEIMAIIVKMLNGQRPVPAERERLAELASFYRGGKGAPPKEKRHLPRITDADFKTPESMKQLCERIIGRPIWVTPEKLKTGRPEGSIDNQVHARKVAAAKQSKNGNRSKLVDDKLEKMKHQDASAFYSAERMVKRDVADGEKAIETSEAITRELRERTTEITKSLRYIYDKHTKK